MGRNRGSVIGNAISPSTSASTGFWTRQEVYFLIKSNSFQLPSYFTLTSNASNVNEGAYITFTLNVNNFIGSGLIPYTVTGVSSDDFVGNLLTGNFVINNGTGNVTFLANLDYVMEGDSMTLSAAGKSVVVIINDVVDTDQYFNYTTLLLSSDTGPTYISDASSNTFEITPFGSVKSDTSQPFQEGYYSGYFNGSASYLTTPDGAFTSLVLDGAFTIEAWINLSALAAVDGSSVRTAAIVAYHNSIITAGGVGVGYAFSLDQTNNTISFGKNGVGPSFTSSYTFLLNTWYHVAIAYTGSVATIYVNGTSLAVTVGVAWTFVGPSGGTVTLRIATFRGYTSYQQDFPGYISNLRIVKGVAVYTGTFTPPTAPLAITQSAGTNISAITGTQTSLLTLQSNRFKDQTAAALALTPAGTPAIKTLQPFTLPTTWATYGAGYFNGSTDYLSIPDNAALEFGTSSITLECWFYMTGTSGYLFDKNNSGSGSVAGFSLYVSTTAITWYYDGANNGFVIPSISTTVAQNQWNHIALVRSVSGTTTNAVFLNGVRVGTSATATAFPNNTQNFRIGAPFLSSSIYAPGAFTGFISNVRLVNGTAFYDPSLTTLTVPTAPLTAIANTSLLTLQYKQGSNNNGFQDSSQNNFLITRNGTPTQGTFTPFSQTGWSGYFNGSSDYLTTTVTTAPGTGSLTHECWIYPIVASYDGVFLNTRSGVTTDGFDMHVSGSNKIVLTYSFAVLFTGPTNIIPNTWSHVAVVRNGASAFSVYLNGALEGTFTNSTDFTSTTVIIGSGPGGATYFNGYISNLRITKTAVYTGAFTLPTTPLAITQSASANISAITGTQTSLLTLQSNRFKDQTAANSGAGLAITQTSTPKVMAFSPFLSTAAYSTATNGGAVYFNSATSDCLDTPTTTALLLDGSFTVECWVYLNSITSGGYFSSYDNGNPGVLLGLNVGADGMFRFRIGNDATSGNMVIATVAAVTNTWYHLAAVLNGTTMTLYVNGISVGTPVTKTVTVTISQASVGRYYSTTNNYYINGYVSNLRVVKGVAVYTANFTPPTAPLTTSGATSAASYPSTTNVNTTFPAENTSLLLNGINGGIIDDTSKNLITTVGDARISTAQKKFGTGSMYFDGTGDYLAIPSSPILGFGTGDFTIEGWLYLSSTSSYSTIISNRTSGGDVTTGRYSVAIRNSAFEFYANGSQIVSAGTVSTSTWTHFAVTRASNNIRLFLSGTQVGSTTAFTTDLSTLASWVGANGAGGETLTGYIDDFRITKYARYTANFTTRTRPFPQLGLQLGIN